MRRFAILILAMGMVAGVAGAAADDGPKPPAPNLFPPKAGCPPNMLGGVANDFGDRPGYLR